jgi:hypothetical protein
MATLTAGSPGANGWSTGPVTIGLAATDNLFGSGAARTQYSLDWGQTWLSTSSPTLSNLGPYGSTGTLVSTVTLSRDGVYHLVYRSIDGAGNVEATHPLTVMIDSTSPINLAEAVTSTPRHSEGEGVTATVLGLAFDNLSGIDTASATYTVTDSQGQTISTGSVTLSPLFVGSYAYQFKVTLASRQNGQGPSGGRNTITIRLKDLAGNTSSASIVVFVPQDHGHDSEGKTSSASVARFDPETPPTPAEIVAVERIARKNSATG